VETKAAVAAVAAHIEESECRNRAHLLGTKRAKECSENSATLRDMRTRGLLMGEDRSALEPAENAANSAAELAADALAKCEQAGNETTQKDEYQLESLRAIAAAANKKLRKRETITASLTARSMANQTAIDDASAKLAAVVAPNNAIQQRFETLKQQVETLAQAMPECTRKLDEVTRALEKCKFTGETEQLPLRHAEQVESQILKARQTEETALINTLAEAEVASAEATAAYESSMDEGPNFAELLVKSEARWSDLDKVAQAEARSYKDAMEATEAVKSDLAAIDSDDDSDEHDSDGEENDNDDSDGEEYPDAKTKKRSEKDAEREAARATLSAKIELLERVAQDKKNDAKTVASAAKAARGELDALRAQQKSTFCPAETLVKQEVAAVDEALASHRDKEGAIMTEVKEKVAAWMAEKESVGADLHRAQLLASAAESEVASNKMLAKSLAEAQKK
jgi:chromosome segregation ATPase